MKHSVKITLLLLGMFLVAQLIGLYVVHQYKPIVSQENNTQGDIVNVTHYNLPYGMDPPADVTPQSTLLSIIFAIIIAVSLMLILMKYHAEWLFRIWFFIVVALALGITFNAVLHSLPYSSIIAIIIALPLSFVKIFQRNIVAHNITEVLIYPGIAAIFVPLLNIWSIIVLLVIISVYDIYAVWHAGFMQKMAKYQIQKLRLFTGFFIPYIGKKEKQLIAQAKASKSKNLNKKVKVNVAILGGGDVVFPIICAGVVLMAMGLVQALIISLCATAALALLFHYSKKGKFYPAMPFISAGCFIGLAIAYLI
ncbi:MAG: presenilin family intramembrane aspartyl protease [Nanoarchaeota archaeon]|nr:presenilin family intramembrane aspartyl protease [Nanoarchaeota archaeon]